MSYRKNLTILWVLCCLSASFTVLMVYNIFKADRATRRKNADWLRGISRNLHLSQLKHAGRSEFVSALDKGWMTWDSIDSPGKYRACVPYPTPDGVFARELSGGLVDEHVNMTIPRCLEHCISMEYTYAALTKGTQCYCTSVHRSSTLLSYEDSRLCHVPCSGDKDYHCGGNSHFSLYRTSVPDPRCCNMSVGRQGDYPLIALASYPRSGNTWTRQLIEQATGVYTGSVYWRVERKSVISREIFKGGNIDYKTKQTICIKTHKSDTEHIEEFDAAVLLMRNPYKSLVAEVFRRMIFDSDVSGSLKDGLEFFQLEEWQKFVDKEGRHWHETNLQWIKNTRRLHVVHYEELERDTERQLTAIVRFLGRPVDDDRLSCAVQDNPSSLSTGVALGNHGVKTRAYLTSDPFTSSMHVAMDAFILSVNQSLIARGHTPLPANYNNIKTF